MPQAMDEDLQPSSFPDNLKKFINDLFEKFKKTPYVMPATAGLIGGIFFLMLLFLIDTCLISLLPPFIMLGMFWGMGIKRGRKLLLGGVMACVVMLVIEAAFFVDMASDYEPAVAHSDDVPRTLRDGVVSPAKGDAQTPFNFTIDVYADNVDDIQIVVLRYKGIESSWKNTSMTPVPGMFNLTVNNETYSQYQYVTTLSDSVNQFCFAAQINGTWIEAWNYSGISETTVFGPVYEDDFEILKPMLYLSAMQVFLQYFLIYALLVGMIWWTRRARRMREKQLEKWAQKQKEAEASAPKDEAKVPSLARAMGLEKDAGEEDTFVCSECGADVPADATKCPSCGEKFD